MRQTAGKPRTGRLNIQAAYFSAVRISANFHISAVVGVISIKPHARRRSVFDFSNSSATFLASFGCISNLVLPFRRPVYLRAAKISGSRQKAASTISA